MTVAELIEALRGMPDDATVEALYDNFCHMNIDNVWLGRAGIVLLVGGGELVKYTEDRPINAPTKEEDRDWCAPDPQKRWCWDDDREISNEIIPPSEEDRLKVAEANLTYLRELFKDAPARVHNSNYMVSYVRKLDK